MDTPAADKQLSFATDIKGLFREHDRESMAKAFDLWSVDDVRSHASAILARLADGSMPCDGAWPAADRVQVFRSWVDSGMAA